MRRPFSVSINIALCLLSLSAILLLSPNTAQAQTSTFTYQGRLTNGGTPANGPFDMEFKLYDAVTAGAQQPQPTPITITFTGPTAVQVTNGVFTVQLDFTAAAFPGANRFLDIGVKDPADSSYTPLSPRQQLTSTPYAIRALSAASADTATTATTATNNVLKGGDTMTGQLVLSGNPTVALGAATKQYVDSGLASLNGANLTAGSVTPDKLAPVYGYFYHTSVPAPIAPGTSVPFDQNGPASGIIRSGIGGTDFVLPDTGVYEITWQVSVNEAGQLVLALNGTDLPSTVVGRYTGTTQIVGNVLIETGVTNSVLSVRAVIATLSVTNFPGGNTGSLVIKRIK